MDTGAAPLSARSWANALLAGWIALIPINAVFVQRVRLELSFAQRALHHLYDAGQLLGLGMISWLLAIALWRLPRGWRIGAAAAIAGVASYAVLAGDLDNFLERTGSNPLVWRLMSAAGGAVALAASFAAAALIARRSLRYAGVAAGVTIAIGNHLVLPLAYPGAHFMLAWSAALMIGVSLVHVLARLTVRPRPYAIAMAVAAAGSLASFAIAPGPVVRGALLGSSGAIAAPFAAEAWTALQPKAVPVAGRYDPQWFAPRQDLPPIPAVRPPSAPDEPIVVLLTVDALRADVLFGPEVASKSVNQMRIMGKRALSFTRAWSPAPYTMGSLRSLFLGVHYFQQKTKRASGRGKRITGPFLAKLLGERGVATVNVKAVNALGIDGSVCRGFAEEIKPKPRTADAVAGAMLERLEGQPGPLFIYSHMIDPHAPYTRGQGGPKDRYLAEVAFVDRQIGRLRAEIKRRGLSDRTYFILSADHGEAFGEHGHDFHSSTVYQEMIHVPLMIEGPGIRRRRITTPVSLIDLTPTILSIFAIDTPGHFMGQSLVPFMHGEDPRLTRPLAVDGGRRIRAMLFDERWKAIIDVERGTEELYDLETDPGERRNLAEEPQASAYFATLRAFFASAD